MSPLPCYLGQFSKHIFPLLNRFKRHDISCNFYLIIICFFFIIIFSAFAAALPFLVYGNFFLPTFGMLYLTIT